MVIRVVEINCINRLFRHMILPHQSSVNMLDDDIIWRASVLKGKGGSTTIADPHIVRKEYELVWVWR